ncbi:Phospholipase A2-beta [Diplonema papillatum]|nr:Phospholipase A2-beta [Diplonema papillatum]
MLAASKTVCLLVVCVALAAANTRDCPEQCRHENCDSPMKVRWGKFCGTRHGACAGQEPCDDVDECCRNQQQCTAISGLIDPKCFEGVRRCLQEAAVSNKPIYTDDHCPKAQLIESLTKGAELAMHLAEHMSGESGIEGEQKMEAMLRKKREIMDEL